MTTIRNESSKRDRARISHAFASKLVVDDNNLYLISSDTNNLQISRVSTDGNTCSPIQNGPASDDKALSRKLRADSEASKATHFSERSEKEHHSIVPIVPPPIRGEEARTKMIVVSNDVFYAEHRRTLFKWRLGAPEWISTGLTDMSQESYDNDSQDLKLAVSGETLYVGKRDGKLFQSFDGGSSWRDVTPSLPLHFTNFKEITFVGSTVYVATDEGVLSSETGAHWRVLTDNAGKRPIIDRLLWMVPQSMVLAISAPIVWIPIADGSKFLQKPSVKPLRSLSLTINSIVLSKIAGYFTSRLPGDRQHPLIFCGYSDCFPQL